jgi:TatD DNase family protein
MKYNFIDIHSHVHGAEYDSDRDEAINVLASLGGSTITIGTDYTESERARKIAERYGNVYFCAGIHPVDKRDEVFDKERLRALASHPKCVGIGECGLDYYWPSEYKWSDGEKEEKERQATLFRSQIELAIEMDLPLMIHGRPSKGSMDAYEDIIRILREYKKVQAEKLCGNIHFFVGSVEIAQEFIRLGFTMSFTGVVTFSTDYDEVLRYLPIEYIQAETDSPYVSPKPYRGTRNEPIHVREVIGRMAELRDITREVLETELLKNAKRVWGIE